MQGKLSFPSRYKRPTASEVATKEFPIPDQPFPLSWLLHMTSLVPTSQGLCRVLWLCC